MFKKYKHIHFVGIGGIGMSGIAQVLITLGYCVTGSDLKKSSTTDQLKRRGAKIFIAHKEKNIGDAHVVVISSAVNNSNPEVIAAKENGIPVVPRAEMLAELMRLKYGIAIAGTHGKTTTTSLVATILDKAGLDPTMVVGGKLNNFRTNARLGKGEFLVAEADESDRSFLKLTPIIAVITNIEPEHMENYRDFDHVCEAYVSFANKTPFYGSVIACIDHPQVKKLLPQIERRVITYGLKEGDYTASDIKQAGASLEFNVHYQEKLLGRVKLVLTGRHNVLNALAAIAVAMELEVPFSKIAKGMKSFKGIERRFQFLLNKKDMPMVVTDYAHHPSEIKVILDAVKEGWPSKRVMCVVQPHRYSRLKNLFNEFAEILSKPDFTIVTPVYSAGEKNIEGISSERLVEKILEFRTNGNPVVFTPDNEKLFDLIKNTATPDDIILFLGAGNIWMTGKEFVKRCF